MVRDARALWEVIARVYPRAEQDHQVRLVQWQFPREGYVALNTDGSGSFGNPGLSRFGGVVRDAHGAWLFGFAGHIGVPDCLHAHRSPWVTDLLGEGIQEISGGL